MSESTPDWYKDAIIYQLHVKCFHDSNGDGIGDFRGLTAKLDYIVRLGITAIWLLPFYPSPRRDDGYDIADYLSIHPDYGSLADFKAFLRAAHARGLKVITELVVNHTSDQHPWFQRARSSPPGSVWRDYYMWSNDPEKYPEARIIFQDFESSNWAWDPVAKAYYWHRFYSHQPDLNFDNPRVRREVFRVLDFWLSLGVDGLRLDAIPYLFARDGTTCENLPETHAFLKELRQRVDEKYSDRMLLGEANQWPEDAAVYFGEGDECHMAFHFPLMPRLFMALRMEDRFPIVDILEQTPAIPDSCQWAMFLRNHDELTLEMVTDEERDYMYRVYAQDPRAKINLGIRRRLAPLLDNHRAKIELMHLLLLTLPGTPIVYYGDEIGMGDNYHLGDRDGVRTPMQWSPDRNAGFSSANPQKLYLPVIIDPQYHHESINVETQEANPSSVLWWIRRAILLRRSSQAFGRGSLEVLRLENPKVMAFIRRYQEERVLVLVNLSRFSQCIDIDLKEFAGLTPVEMFSQNAFHPIEEDDYRVTLGPYGHFLFNLIETKRIRAEADEHRALVKVKRRWTEVFAEGALAQLEGEILPRFLLRVRWFGSKGRSIRRIEIEDRIQIDHGELVTLLVQYREGLPERYLLPLAFTADESRIQTLRGIDSVIVAEVSVGDEAGVLFDATFDSDFCNALIAHMRSKRKARGQLGDVVGSVSGRWKQELSQLANEPPRPMGVEQSNTSVLYGEQVVLKVFRKLDEGVNPELEMLMHLSGVAGFEAVPSYVGSLEWRPRSHPSNSCSVAVAQSYIPNQGDGWRHALDHVHRYYERILSWSDGQDVDVETLGPPTLLTINGAELTDTVLELVGSVYLEAARTLALRTGELHEALALSDSVPAFAPESFTPHYKRSLYQSLRTFTRKACRQLQGQQRNQSSEMQADVSYFLGHEEEMEETYRKILSAPLLAKRTRIHGDYHLGQVLFTGKDYVIIDFEGEPARPLNERKLKRNALQDVAGMIRSYHYAAYVGLATYPSLTGDDMQKLKPFADLWYRCIGSVFIHNYRLQVSGAQMHFVPIDERGFETLLNAFLVNKACYEVLYELNSRPDWTWIPLAQFERLLPPESQAPSSKS